MKDHSKLLTILDLEPLGLPQQQEEELLKKSVHLLRLRLHEGYYFDIYTALDRMSGVLQKKHPITGLKYKQLVTTVANHEKDVLNKIMEWGDVEVSRPPSDLEKQIIATLQTETPLKAGEEEKLLKFFLSNEEADH